MGTSSGKVLKQSKSIQIDAGVLKRLEVAKKVLVEYKNLVEGFREFAELNQELELLNWLLAEERRIADLQKALLKGVKDA